MKERVPCLASQKVDDLKRVLKDADSHQLLAVVATVHHHRVDNTLNDRALPKSNLMAKKNQIYLSLAKATSSVAAGGVSSENHCLLLHGDVILKI